MSDDIADRLRELAAELEADDESGGDDVPLVERARDESGLYDSNDFVESECYSNAVDVSYDDEADAAPSEMEELRESDWYLVSVGGDCLTIRPEEDEP